MFLFFGTTTVFGDKHELFHGALAQLVILHGLSFSFDHLSMLNPQCIVTPDTITGYPMNRRHNNYIILRFEGLCVCAACWASFMCHHELWPTALCHPFSSPNSSPGLAGWKHCQKLLSPSLDLLFKIFLFHDDFLIFFSVAIFSPYFLLTGLLLQSVALFQPGN